MQPREKLTERFNSLVQKLHSWDDLTTGSRPLQVRAIIEHFILSGLPEGDKDLIERRCKSHKMAYPPQLTSINDITSVQTIMNDMIQKMEQSQDWEEFEKKVEPGEGQLSDEEALENFGKILLSFMEVPKEDLPGQDLPESK